MNQTYAGLKRTVAPATEILSLADTESYLKVNSDGGSIDQDVTAFISFAREQVETALGRTLLRSTWRLSLKNWPGRDYQNWPQGVTSGFAGYYQHDHVKLPMAAPLSSVSSVTYLDTASVLNTMPQGNVAGGYNVDASFEPGRIVLPFSQVWPTAILLPGAPIQITYVAGYADLAALVASFEGYHSTVMAMKLIIAYVFENRVPPSEMRKSSVAAGIQYVIDELLAPHRVFA